jgi:hypothetical protein
MIAAENSAMARILFMVPLEVGCNHLSAGGCSYPRSR